MNVSARLLRAAALVVVVLLASALPVAQLTLVADVHACCCPDPDDCHCPEDEPADADADSMRACHSKTDVFISLTLAPFAAPSLGTLARVERVASSVFSPLPLPHPGPPPRRPDAPS